MLYLVTKYTYTHSVLDLPSFRGGCSMKRKKIIKILTRLSGKLKNAAGKRNLSVKKHYKNIVHITTALLLFKLALDWHVCILTSVF